MGAQFFRRHAVLLVAGVAGLVVFLLYMDRVSPAASFDLTRSREEIKDLGHRYLTDLGFDTQGLQQDAWAEVDASLHVALQQNGGVEAANRIFRSDTSASHEWALVWYDRSVSNSQSVRSFRVWMTPAGRPLGFECTVPDTLQLPSLDHETARGLAMAFLERSHITVEGFQLLTDSDVKQMNRIDHKFVWRRTAGLIETTVSVRVQGNKMGGFRLSYSPAGAAQRAVADTFTVMTFLYAASFGILFLLFFYIVTLFLRKYHEGEVGVRTALLVFAAVYVTSVLNTINVFPSIGSNLMIGDMNRANTRLVMCGIQVFMVHVFFGVMAFAAWSVGESSARTVAPEKLTGADSALFRHFFTRDLGSGLLTGYAWGGVALGAVTLFVLAFSGRSGFAIMSAGMNGVPEAYVPALQPILHAFEGALLAEVIFRIFFLNYLHEKTRRAWPGVLIATVVWTFASITIWSPPPGSLGPGLGLLGTGMFGLFFAFLYLRYDAVTAIAANFTLMAIAAAVPMLTSGGGYGHTMGLIFGGLMVIPIGVGITGVLRNKPFAFTGQTLPDHIQRISERERIGKELEIARNVQVSLLPKMQPEVGGFDIAGICIPAKEVGGDYYDFVSLPNNRIGIALGDVSGKGVPAAIYMTLTKGILQSHAEEGVSPREVLIKVNSLMYRTIERNSFVSMLYAILDAGTRKIRYARAGQCPVILTQGAGGRGSFVTPRGMALGLENGKVFDAVLEEQELQLGPGQVLVFYTDGFTEAMNAHTEEFGEDRLMDSIARRKEHSAAALIQAVCADVTAFTGDAPQHDDMTMVVVRVL
jgi:phosphoserine phosphatase RsbU/P